MNAWNSIKKIGGCVKYKFLKLGINIKFTIMFIKIIETW